MKIAKRNARQPISPYKSRGHEVCGFCGKDDKEAPELVAGFNAYICNECVLQAAEMLASCYRQRAKRLAESIDVLEQEYEQA